MYTAAQLANEIRTFPDQPIVFLHEHRLFEVVKIDKESDGLELIVKLSRGDPPEFTTTDALPILLANPGDGLYAVINDEWRILPYESDTKFYPGKITLDIIADYIGEDDED